MGNSCSGSNHSSDNCPFCLEEKKKQEKAEASRKEKQKEQEKLEGKRAERRAEEKERMELLISKGDSVEVVLSKFDKGEAEIVSEKMLDGITSVGFDVKA